MYFGDFSGSSTACWANLSNLRKNCYHFCMFSLTSVTANAFTLASIASASEELWESMLQVAQTSTTLEQSKLQQEIAKERKWQNQARADRAAARLKTAMELEGGRCTKGGKAPKKPKKDPQKQQVEEEEEKRTLKIFSKGWQTEVEMSHSLTVCKSCNHGWIRHQRQGLQ